MSRRYSVRPYGGIYCVHPDCSLTDCLILANRYHPTRTRTLWSDPCFDAVAGEGSRLIRPTWMLFLLFVNTQQRWLDVDWAGSGCCGVLTTTYIVCKTNWVYALNTPIYGGTDFFWCWHPTFSIHSPLIQLRYHLVFRVYTIYNRVVFTFANHSRHYFYLVL